MNGSCTTISRQGGRRYRQFGGTPALVDWLAMTGTSVSVANPPFDVQRQSVFAAGDRAASVWAAGAKSRQAWTAGGKVARVTE